MRFREVFRFEVGHQYRRPATWFFLLLLLGLTVLLVAGGANPVGTGTLVNAPIKLATYTLFVGMLGTLVTAALFVEAAYRDRRWRMHALFRTAPVRDWEYLAGRFAGALAVNAAMLVAVPLGLLVASRLPSVSAEMLGPFRVSALLLPYLGFLLPNLLVTAAVLFGATVLTRRSLPGYLGALGLLAVYVFTANEIARPNAPAVLTLLDPTGSVALTALTRGWTRAELDTRLIALGGVLLWNRVFWTVLAAGILAFTYRCSRLTATESPPRRRVAGLPDAEVEPAARLAALAVAPAAPPAPRSFGARTRARQTLAVTRVGLRQIVGSRDFLLVAIALVGLAIALGREAIHEPLFGTPLWPLTQRVLAGLTGRFIELLLALLTVFYAGELVWRERDAGIEQMGDSAPVPDWAAVTGKLLALGLALAILQGLLMASGILLQALEGYFTFEPRLYLRVLFGLQLPDYLLFAVLALLVHVTVNQKYLGHMIGALAFLAIKQAPRLGLEHNLLVYGADPGWAYSDMSGFGATLGGILWFKLHWAAWALMLAVVALVMWVRGAELGLRERARLARRRLTRYTSAVAGAGALILTSGGFVFYNTNVINEYRTTWASGELEAEYERRYKRFERAPQPWLSGIRLQAEIYPSRREISVRGTYHLVNRTGDPIDSVHVSSIPYPGVTLGSVRFHRPAKPVLEDPRRGYRIYALDHPLPPGDSLSMDFEVELALHGFSNRALGAVTRAVSENATYLEMWRVLPAIGYQRELLELADPAARREHALGPRSSFRPIDDLYAARTPRSSPHSDWIDFEGTVGTAANQIAVLPGTLRRTWRAGDRQYFEYRTEAPIMSSISLMSGRYSVHEANAETPSSDARETVRIRVLYDPRHAFNLQRMIRAAQASLSYYAAQFAPYPYREFSLVEIPASGNFARAYPGGLVFTESSHLVSARIEDAAPNGIDTPFLFVAHELAHQWWGHQVIGADVEGSQVLSETLAQYSALMALERTHGVSAAHWFVRNMQLSYLDGRGSHTTPEVPLMRSGDQEYIHYRKGVVVMYALQDYVGEERVNAALRALIGKYGTRGPPYPTTRDLYRELRAVTPDSLQGLLDDMVATITLWDLSATGARATQTPTGAYRVTLDVQASKVRSDSVGNDTPVAMNDLVEIGVFAEPRPGERDGAPLYLGKHQIRSGEQSITVTVPSRPSRAAVDPYHKLITRHLSGLINAKFTAVTIAP